MGSTRSYIEFYLTGEGWTCTSWQAINKIGALPAGCLIGLQLEQWDPDKREQSAYDVRLLQIDAGQAAVTALINFGIPTLIAEHCPEIRCEIDKLLRPCMI
jgi:hypothetical protein